MAARLGRRTAIGLAGALALAGCVFQEAPPPAEMFPPLSYGYLTKLRLNVASIAIDDSWTPAFGAGEHVELLSPVQPLQALVQMARDRLVASGTTGQARFIVQDASIIAGPGRLDGSLSVRLEVSGPEGRSGYAEASVIRSRTGGPGDPDGGRNAAYQLTKNMMDDMNVELEYQVRHRLGDFLLATSNSAPLPPPVEQQALPPPPGVAPALPALPPLAPGNPPGGDITP